MPIKKSHLTEAQRSEYLASGKWLSAAGADIDVSTLTASEPSGLRINQWGPELNHRIFNLYQVRSRIVVGIRLLAMRSGIIISDCNFVLPWETHPLDLYSVSDETSMYRPAKELEYDRDSVLNHRIIGGLRLRRGEPVEGLVIAMGSAPLPRRHRHGMLVEVELLLADQFDEVYSANVELRADHRIGGKRVDLGKRSTLFEPQELTFKHGQRLPEKLNNGAGQERDPRKLFGRGLA